MADFMNFEKRGSLFHLDLNMPMPSSKARAISEVVEADAGVTSIDIFSERRLHRIVARGLIRPVTMRLIIHELAR